MSHCLHLLVADESESIKNLASRDPATPGDLPKGPKHNAEPSGPGLPLFTTAQVSGTRWMNKMECILYNNIYT